MTKPLRRALTMGLLVVSGCMLVWAILPNKRMVDYTYIEPTAMQASSIGHAGSPSIIEGRQVTLELPVTVRSGDQGEISLIFEPISSENLTPQTVAKPEVYDRYSLMTEGRFELAGMRVKPANSTRESLPSGQTINLKWQVETQRPGLYPGTVWLSLRYLPLDGSQASQVPIYVQEVNIQVTSLFGLSGPLARILGGAGILVSVLLSYDVVISWVLKKNILKSPQMH